MKKEKLEKTLQSLSRAKERFCSIDECKDGGPLSLIINEGHMIDPILVKHYRKLHLKENESFKGLGLEFLHHLMMLEPAQRFLWWKDVDFEKIEAAHNKTLVLSFSSKENYYVTD